MAKQLKEILASNVRAVRVQKGITQEELARRTKLSVRYISKVENDPPDVTLHNLEKLAIGLEVPVADLVTDRKARLPRPSTKEAEAVRQTIRLLNLYLQFED